MLCFLVAVGFVHSFLYLHIMESVSLDSLIDPEFQEDDDSNKFDEASRCDPDPASLAREFEESNNCENENEQDGSGEEEEDETKIPKRCACSKRCFLLFEQKQQLIIEYRRNLAEFTKDEKDILL